MTLTETDPSTGQIRRSWGSFGLRMVGAVVAGLGIVVSYATWAPWVIALTVLAWVAMVGLMLLGLFRWSRWQAIPANVMLFAGAIVSPFANYAPSYFASSADWS